MEKDNSMSKEIDINNEEEILKECDFDYFYDIENCSRELCMFYNDIQHQKTGFNCKQAHIDLGRIAITLNKQSQRIAELEKQLAEKDKLIGVYADEHAMLQCKIADLAVKEIKAEKFAIEQLKKMKDFCDGMKWAMVHLTKENTQTIQTVLDEIDNQIKQLKEGK